MCMKWKSNLLLVLFYTMPIISFAVSQNTMTFNQYSNATCEDYTGTWKGTLVAPKLAQSWPLNVSLYNTSSKVVGNIDSSSLTMEKAQKKIWADCKNGKLINIFWGDKGACGGYSQEGFLIDPNTLLLKLHFETLKEDTYFIAFLKKENDKYSLPIPTDAKDLEPGIIKTCHEKWQH